MEAIEEAAQVSERVPSAGFVAGGAHYRLAELHRLRGQLDLAEREYAVASGCGREVQPGLALLRLAQGNPATATPGWTVHWPRAGVRRGSRCCLLPRWRLPWSAASPTALPRH